VRKAAVPTEHVTGYAPRLTALIGELAATHRSSRHLMQASAIRSYTFPSAWGPSNQEVTQDLNIYTPEQLRRRHTHSQRDSDVVRARSFRRPRRLILMASLVIVSLLGAGALWQSPLVSHKLKEYMTRSASSPTDVVSPSPAYRELPPSRR
jgi:hypothetical protein